MVIGCGLIVAVVFAIVAGIFHWNIINFMLVGGLLGMFLGIFGVRDTDYSGDYEKPKRYDQGKDKRKAREGVLVSRDYSPPKSIKRHRDFSRLEVPGGYVPFEMTRTETKTKDTVKTETRIKTYIDSNDLPTVLSNHRIEHFSDGEQHTVKLISSGTTRYGNTFYRLVLDNGSRANVFQSEYQAFNAVENAYFNGRRSGYYAVPRIPLSVTIKRDGQWQHVKTATEASYLALPF